MKRVLFITWDGPQVRYLETLFLPIFARLRERGYEFHVLQFTWGDAHRIKETAEACETLGIPYRSRRIWRAGRVGPLLSAMLGGMWISRAARQSRIDILMPRSLMPALAALAMRGRRRLKIVFDADGLFADERVDFGGLSPYGLTYRFLREVEAEMTRCADRVLTRTLDGAVILADRAGAGTDAAKFYVVSNGIDPERFLHAHEVRDSAAEQTALRLCFCGSFGAKYSPEMMLTAVRNLKDAIPEVEFRIFTADQAVAQECLRSAALDEARWITVRSLRSADVPMELAQCDVGVALIRRTFSTRSVIAIKIGEYLLAGLPVICADGVGGAQDLPDNEVIYSASAGDSDSLLAWIQRLRERGRPHVRAECQELGLAHFGIDATVRQYAAALEGL